MPTDVETSGVFDSIALARDARARERGDERVPSRSACARSIDRSFDDVRWDMR